jgi:hypothetical protein
MSWFNKVVDVMEDKRIIKLRPHAWKARLIVSLILLIASTVGVIITYFSPAFAWSYWCYMVIFFALLCIWLSWYVARHHQVDKNVIWREILHWLGLMIAVLIISFVVKSGLISYLIGALFVLVLLGLTLFLAGVHFDAVFMVIGILLWLLAILTVFFVKYLIVILVPVAVLIGLLFVWRYLSKSRAMKEEGKDI